MINILNRSLSRISFSTSKDFRKQILHELSRNRNYVRDNSRVVLKHVANLVENQEWRETLFLLKQVKLNTINKWDNFNVLRKTVRKKLCQFHSLNPNDQIRFLKILKTLKYEPESEVDTQFYQIIEQLIKKNQVTQIFSYSAFLLALNPSVFKTKQQLLQQELLKANDKLELSRDMNLTLHSGFISYFWSQKFIKNFDRSKVDSRMNDYFDFSDLSIPSKIEKAKETTHSATQIKIGQFLKDLQYNIKAFQSINNFQVDYIIGQRFILEYHGTHHYKINHQKPTLTSISKWIEQVLGKRGFQPIIIPFYEWESYMDEKNQKGYLIQKIEQSILQKLI